MTELNPEEDEAFLVSLLFSVTARAAVDDALAAVAPEDFFDTNRGAIWKAAKALHDSDQRITARAVRGHGTNAAIEAILARSAPPSAANYPTAVREVVRCAQLRRLVQVADRIRQRALAAEDIAQALSWASDELTRMDTDIDEPDVRRFDELLDRWWESMTATTPMRVFPTPWAVVNEEIAGGLHGGRFYVIGARPGEGKSLAAHNAAEYAASCGHEALVFSVEMGHLEVTGRIVASGAQVEMRDISRRALTDWSAARIAEYRERARAYPLSIVDKADVSVPYIRSVCRNHKRRHGLDVVVVDYLQLITPEPNRSREQQVAQISRQLKVLSRELDCAVVVPAQLNRNPLSRSNSRPLKSDLRESGGIEADADVVMLLARGVNPADHDRPGEFNGQLDVYIDKNRQGRECQLSLPWRAHYATIG